MSFEGPDITNIQLYNHYKDNWEKENIHEAADKLMNARYRFVSNGAPLEQLRDRIPRRDARVPFLSQKLENVHFNAKTSIFQQMIQNQLKEVNKKDISDIMKYFPIESKIDDRFLTKEPFADVLKTLKADLNYDLKNDELARLYKPETSDPAIKTREFDFDVEKVNMLLIDTEQQDSRVNRLNREFEELNQLIKALSSNVPHERAQNTLSALRSLAFNLECDIQKEIEYQKNLAKFSQIYDKKLEYNHMAVREPAEIGKAFKDFFSYLWQTRTGLKDGEYERRKRLAELKAHRLFGDQLANGKLLNDNLGFNRNYNPRVDRANEGLADIKLQIEKTKSAKEGLHAANQIRECNDFMKSEINAKTNYTALIDRYKDLRNHTYKSVAHNVIAAYE